MEYMLLRDSSVLPYEPIASAIDVVEELHNKGGVAYYWHNDYVGWSCITPLFTRADEIGISLADVPAEVLLAHMLE